MAAAAGVRLDRDGLVTVLTIDRPEARNAIARATMQELAGAIDEVEASPARVLVVTGAGTRVFVAGGDLKELASIRTHEDATAMADDHARRARPAGDAAHSRGGRGQRRRLRRRRRGGGGVRHPDRRRRRALRLQPGGARDHARVGRHRAAHRAGRSRTGLGAHDDRPRARRRGRTHAGTVRRGGAARGVRSALA